MVTLVQTPRTALYAGSFDPFTNGHLDVLTSALRLFDEVVVGIGVHSAKSPIFTAEERAGLVQAAMAAAPVPGSTLRVSFFDDLVIDEARRQKAVALVRGLRDGTDLDDEMRMSGMNGALAPEIVTLLLPASPAVRPITATLVRQIARMGGDVSAFVPQVVAAALKQKMTRT